MWKRWKAKLIQFWMIAVLCRDAQDLNKLILIRMKSGIKDLNGSFNDIFKIKNREKKKWSFILQIAKFSRRWKCPEKSFNQISSSYKNRMSIAHKIILSSKSGQKLWQPKIIIIFFKMNLYPIKISNEC